MKAFFFLKKQLTSLKLFITETLFLGYQECNKIDRNTYILSINS